MIVDFHTHIFPDKVARGAVASLASAANLPAYTDGTAAGLRAALARAGVTVGVNLPVLTAPRQFEGVLRFATELNATFRGEGILSFAGVHPAQENIAAAMRAVREAGIRGVKIHPEYQDTFIDDFGRIALIFYQITLENNQRYVHLQLSVFRTLIVLDMKIVISVYQHFILK